MEKNKGQLFKIEYDRRDEFKSGGYFSDDEYFRGDRPPMFRIKYKPRQRCHVHQILLQKQQQQAQIAQQQKAQALAQAVAHVAAAAAAANSQDRKALELGGDANPRTEKNASAGDKVN